VNEPRPGALRAEELVRRLGLSYDHVLGTRFAINVFIAAIVIAAALSSQSSLQGVEQGLLKVGQVVFGSVVGILVSWITARFWLLQPPADRDAPD